MAGPVGETAPQMISSPRNREVLRVVRRGRDAAARRREGLLVVEGPKLVDELLSRLGPQAVERVYVSAEFAEGDGSRWVRRCPVPPVVVAPAAFRRMADTRTPQGVLALARRPRHAAAGLWRAAGAVLALDAVQDPGNVGALVRAAAAFGAAGAVLGPGCADPWGPKALRGAMGAAFSLPLVEAADLAKMLSEARAAGRRVVALDARGAERLDRVPLDRAVLLLGSEGRGLGEAAAAADVVARIPFADGMESLNVATAAAVALYEAARQVREERGP
ncbi:MAG: RNA methyltransferase [Clostridia bacterium]|nr:RNA methyltransferase [Clostridia bacterium]